MVVLHKREMAADEELVQRLPTPLAQLYRRAHNAKTPLERHLTALYLWEAGLKLLGAVALVEAAELPAERLQRDAELVERLKNLARPSLGHWWEFVRRLVPLLADSGDAAFQKMRDGLLGRSRDDLPRAAGLDAVLREVLAGQVGARATVRLSELFDRLVQYRNQEVGHGASGRRPGDFYERMGQALLGGVAEVLDRLGVLAGRRLLYIAGVRAQSSGEWLVERYELLGEAGRRIESLLLPSSERDRLPRPERVFLDDSAAAGAAAKLTSLHPLLLFDPDAQRVLFLNSRRGRKKAEYLCYTSGEVVERPELGGEQSALLARLLSAPEVAPAAEEGREQADLQEAEGAAEPSAGRHELGEFQILSELGRGGMGIVYRAWQPSLGRQVALKKLQHVGDAKAEARFAREIRALGRVDHPHLVKIFTSGAEGDQWFYAMELIEGAPLAEVATCLQSHTPNLADVRVDTWYEAVSSICSAARERETRQCEARQRKTGEAETTVGSSTSQGEMPAAAKPGRLPHPTGTLQGSSYIRHIVELVAQVADAAHCLHEAGILHRDIKPGNIIVTADGRQAVLMDLGLAQLADDVEGRLTRTRQFVGTLRYASPEQIMAVGRLDRRSDVYSLGATLYELLTLRPLFGADEHTPTPELMQRIQFEDPVRPRKYVPAIPRDLEAIVLKCLEKHPDKRYPTAQALVEDLGRFLEGRPVTPRPPGAVGRLWRWCRRKPAIAALSGLLLLTAVLAFVAVTTAWIEADGARRDAVAKRQEALANLVQTEKAKAELADKNQELEKQQQELQVKNEELERTTAKLAKLAKKQMRLGYNQSLALAHREWESGNLAKWETLLNRCPPSLRGWDWALLKSLGHGELFSLGATHTQRAVAFSADGRWLAHGGEEPGITIRDAHTGQRVHLLTKAKHGHTKEVTALAFSPDSKRLASASADGTVKLWDVLAGTEVATIEVRDRTSRVAVNGVALHPDGQKFATISADDAVRIWSLEGKALARFPCTSGFLGGLAFSPDGRMLACPSATGTGLALWNTVSFANEYVFRGHTNQIYAIAFSPDGRYVASGGRDFTVKLWDMTIAGKMKGLDTTLCKTLRHDDVVSCLAFSPDGNRLASGSFDQTVRVWDVAKEIQTACLRGHASLVLSLAFSNDGRYLASAGHDRCVKIWETDAPVDRPALLGADISIPFYAVAFANGQGAVGEGAVGEGAVGEGAVGEGAHGASPQAVSAKGQQLIGCGTGGMVVWDALRRKVLDRLDEPGEWASVSVSSDGRFAALGESQSSKGPKKNGRILVWDLHARARHKLLTGHSDAITAVAFQPHSHQLASASRDGSVLIWDVSASDKPRPLTPNAPKTLDSIWALAWSEDGRLLAAGDDRAVKILDAQTGQQLHVLDGGSYPARALAFSPDGRLLVAGGGDRVNSGEILVWQTADWKLRHRFASVSGSVSGIAFHPRGRLIGGSTYNRSVLICDVLEGQELFTLHAFQFSLRGLCWDATGRLLASADGNIPLWEVNPAGEIFTLRRHSKRVSSVAFHPEGTKLASVSNDATIQLWDTATGQPIGLPLEQSRPHYSTTVAWGPDGKLLAYDNGKSVRIRDMTTQATRDLPFDDFVDFLTFSPDGTTLALTYRKAPTIRLYDTSTWTQSLALAGHEERPNSLAFSPDGTLLASAGIDKTVIVWDVASGGKRHTLTGHEDGVQEVCFVDDVRLASCSKDRTIRIWDTRTGECIRILKGDLASVWSVAYDPGGKKLVSVDDIGLFKIWDVDAGKEVGTLRGHAGSAVFVTFNPKSRLFATAGTDGTIRLWDLTTFDFRPGQRKERERWLRWYEAKGMTPELLLSAPRQGNRP